MARKKITPEEETPKTVAPEESTAADISAEGEAAPAPMEEQPTEGRRLRRGSCSRDGGG